MIAAHLSRALAGEQDLPTVHSVSLLRDGASASATTTIGKSRVVKRKGGANLIG